MNADVTTNVIPFAPPALSDVLAYRGIHVIGTVRFNKELDKNVLTASHYASCLVFGKNPLWGVWAANGKFLRFYGHKTEIMEAYPKRVWRRKMASWHLLAVDDLPADKRRAVLREKYKT